MVQGGDAEKKINGYVANKWDLDNAESQFTFVANAVFQTEKLAFVFGGVVNDYENGYMSYYYGGVNYYFSLDKFSPYMLARLGYGLGKFDDKLYLKDKVTLLGYYFEAGAGTKLYLGNSWGLTAEFGFNFTGFSVDDKLKTRYGSDVGYEYEQSENALSLTIGVFFYP